MSEITIANHILSKIKAPQVTRDELHDENLEGLCLDIKHSLPFKDSMRFITDILDYCIDAENSTYSPESYEISSAVSVLRYYAGLEIPEDPDAAYLLVYETDLLEQIIPYINQTQLRHLTTAAQKLIDFEQRKIVASVESETQELLNKAGEILEINQNAFKEIYGFDYRVLSGEGTAVVTTEQQKLGKVIPFPS